MSLYNRQVDALSGAVFVSLIKNGVYRSNRDSNYLVECALAELNNPSTIDGDILPKIINSITELLTANKDLNGKSNKFKQEVYEIYLTQINKQKPNPEVSNRLDEILIEFKTQKTAT